MTLRSVNLGLVDVLPKTEAVMLNDEMCAVVAARVAKYSVKTSGLASKQSDL